MDGVVGPETVGRLYRRAENGVIQGSVFKLPQLTMPMGFGPPLRWNSGLPGPFLQPLKLDRIPAPLSSASSSSQRVESSGYFLTSSLVFNPFAKPSKGDHSLEFKLDMSLPWPAILPDPMELELERSGDVGSYVLDAKLKIPYKLVNSKFIELKPYFFTGAGVSQSGFENLNIGLGSKLKLKIWKDIAGSGLNLGLEADGGGKWQHDFDSGKSGVKGYGTFGLTISGPIPFLH